jgi:hypothetical protein
MTSHYSAIVFDTDQAQPPCFIADYVLSGSIEGAESAMVTNAEVRLTLFVAGTL